MGLQPLLLPARQAGYFRFQLSLRDIETLHFERGVTATLGTVRRRVMARQEQLFLHDGRLFDSCVKLQYR